MFDVFMDQARHFKVPAKGAHGFLNPFDLAMLHAPSPRGAQVVQFAGHRLRGILLRDALQFPFVFRREAQIKLAVTGAGFDTARFVFVEMIPRVLADDFVQVVAPLFVAPHQRLGNERRQHRQGRACDGLRGGAVESAAEDGEAA
ncbi:MAG: hypothetical protein DWB59_00445, partial [Anaerolineae bacterium]|nr:hypothetical protein [Anaerolineae bacterium]